MGPISTASFARLDVLLVYENFATGARAKHAIDHLLDHSDLQTDIHFHLWNFDVLHDAKVSKHAADEAAEADIVVLSTQGKQELPGQVKRWLQQWLDSKGDEPAALVVSQDCSARNPSGENSTLDFLRTLVPVDVDLFPHFGETPKEESDWTIEQIRKRADTTSSLLKGILHQPRSHDRWGINE